MDSEWLIESSGLLSFSFVNIDHLPFLIHSECFFSYSNIGTFIISSSYNFHNFLRLEIQEVFSLVLENLEPSTICAPNLKVVCSSGVLDIPRFSCRLRFDGLSFLVKPPFLGVKTICSLNHEIVTNDVEKSSLSESRFDIKWSFYVQTVISI